jgi:hypothetical protein
VSDVTLDGANETLALESALEMMPPFVGETTCGGERPLPVLVVGSGGVPSVPVGVVDGSPPLGVVALPPTRTVIVPVPEPAPVAVVPVPFAGSPEPEVAVVSLLPVPVVVGGVEPVVVSCGKVTVCEGSVDVVVPPVVPPVPDVSVVVGGFGLVGVMLFRFGSGFAFVSVGGTVVVLLEPVPVPVPGEVPVVLPDDVCVVPVPEVDPVPVELPCGRVMPCCSWASAAATAAALGSDTGTCSVVCCCCCVVSWGFGSGIGSGVVSGTAIAVSTPSESSYVGS